MSEQRCGTCGGPRDDQRHALMHPNHHPFYDTLASPAQPGTDAALRAAAQRVIRSHLQGYWVPKEMDELEAALTPLPAEPTLDVERPEGWKLLYGLDDGGWWATASGYHEQGHLIVVSTSAKGKLYATPTEAADDLRSRLATIPEGAPDA